MDQIKQGEIFKKSLRGVGDYNKLSIPSKKIIRAVFTGYKFYKKRVEAINCKSEITEDDVIERIMCQTRIKAVDDAMKSSGINSTWIEMIKRIELDKEITREEGYAIYGMSRSGYNLLLSSFYAELSKQLGENIYK